MAAESLWQLPTFLVTQKLWGQKLDKMNRRPTPFSKKLNYHGIAGSVTTKVGVSISVITHFKEKKAFVVRIVSTGNSFFIQEKFISDSLQKSMEKNKLVSLPSGSIIPVKLALKLGIPYKATLGIPDKEGRLSSGPGLSTTVTKGGIRRTYQTRKFILKKAKFKFSGQRIIDQIFNPNDPDETDDPGPMIKGKP
jgi:hypothetical protein